MIPRRVVVCLGVSQLVCWGISYYLVGGFGEMMAADLGWSQALVHGGFSIALIVMGFTSPVIGRLVDRHGGSPVMVAGSCVLAAGCTGLALAEGIAGYYAAWLCLGVGMRLTLYDAAFAALARIGGPAAKRPIAQITLLGGLASTTFWPIGHALADAFGWRGALFVYAGIALMTIPLHLAIPRGRFDAADLTPRPVGDRPYATRREAMLAGGLYALIVTLTNFLNTAMSAHMIGLLGGLGVTAAVAVWISTLRGVGQSLARLADVLFGRRLHPLDLNLAAVAVLPFCFLAGLASGELVLAAIAFAFFYGAGNGLATITRGTLPLVLFDPRTYGSLVGRLLVPSFLLSAVAPVAYALVIERFGDAAALHLSILVALVALGASAVLRRCFAPASRTREA